MVTLAKTGSSFEESAPGCSSTLPSSISDDSGTRPVTVPVPSLYPVYLPYKTQRRLLSSVQLKLEESCFEFARKWLPDMIAAEGWEFAEQVQLSEWTMKIHKEQKALPRTAITLHHSEEEFKEILFATHKLEHCAVHRDRIYASRIAELIEYALALVRMLKDTARTHSIERIGRRVKLSLESMEDKKRVLEKTLNSEMESIATKRAELDLLEKIAVEKMVKDDKNDELAAGSALDEILDQDEVDFQNGGFLGKRGGQNSRSAASEAELSEWTIGSSTSKMIASIQDRPEAKFPMISRSHALEELSVLPMNNKPSSGTETAKTTSRTCSTDTSQLNKGPLFTLQLSDSIHNPNYQSTSVQDKLDFYKLSLDYIDTPKTMGKLDFPKNIAGAFDVPRHVPPHTQLSNPFQRDIGISQSAVSTESNVNLPNPNRNPSNPLRNLVRPHQSPVKDVFESPSKYFDIAATTDDEIT